MITIVAADQKYEGASTAQITDLTSRLQISKSNCVEMRQKCGLIKQEKQQLKDQLSTVTKENEILLNDIMKLKDNISKR